MEVIRPFGPTIAKTTIPESLVKELNSYVDETLSDEKKSQDLDYGKMLDCKPQPLFLAIFLTTIKSNIN